MADLQAQLQSGLSGSYVLERELGRGGMATVFLARDLRHDRPVALKVLHPELAASLGPDRFQREIRLAARLQHPHILTVLDSGEAAGRLWFTMPYVEGESLRDRLRRERQLPVEDALRVAREAAQALHYAHEHGVVHRDIKPENLLLTRDGNTLVADFGIARALGVAGEERLTETGLAVGTPAYMSPEQSAGDRGVDARTDVYSLAAVLYETLAGEPPYTGATTQALMVKRLTEPAPSARATRPNVPDGVDQAIRKALSPVAADRFGGMAQFAQALQAGAQALAAAPTVATPPAGTAPVPPPAPAAATPRRRGFPVAATALVLGILIGLGVLFAWRRGNGDGSAGGSRVLAVIPFENLGDSADAYFADGVTDEVRTKLARVTGLDVIARGSSNEYRGTTKRSQEIAQELGAGYLLTGTVRWIKGADGNSRVRVTPELVEVLPGQTPRSRWGEQFDAAMTDVFKVQAEIAGKVVSALDVALADSVREELVSRPTKSVAAYDAFLKAEAAAASGAPADQRRAVGFYQEAIRLDPSFALAWARMGRTAAYVYVNTGSLPEVAEITRVAAERARQLAPHHPESYAAHALYQANVGRDPAQALATIEAGLRTAPNSADLLATASSLDQTLGTYETAVTRLERAFTLDPRSTLISRRLGYSLMVLRRYSEAKTAFARGLTLAPGNLGLVQNLALVHLGEGNVEAVRRLADNRGSSIERDRLLAYMSQYEELGWTLDRAQQDRVLQLGPELFDDDRGAWAMVRAHFYHQRGDQARQRAWADTARVAFEILRREVDDDAQYAVIHGVALAYLGRFQEAIREGERGLELLPPSKDAYFGPYVQHQLVRINLLAGEHERALDLLEPLLKMPYTLTPAWLRIDPMFEPVRNHPRFRRLVEAT
ncbi:MAG TPA: protein kinase [Gemmatimonadales bacterium]|nr:protein kinase [Gemmatimonadales bacterium]